MYCHIIFIISHKMLSPIKVNLTRISEKFAICQLVLQLVCELTYYYAH